MSTKVNDGGFVIPIPCPTATDGREFDGGLTVRDWMAGQALAGLVQSEPKAPGGHLASWAYEIADAMLAARNGGQP